MLLYGIEGRGSFPENEIVTHLWLCVRSFMADSWASRQRRSTESEADAEAFRRDLDGGDDFRLDEVATLSDNNRVSWQICNVYCLFSPSLLKSSTL